MKKRIFIIVLAGLFLTELAALFFFAAGDTERAQDAVRVNETRRSIEAAFDALESYEDRTGLAWAVLDSGGRVLYRTGPEVSDSINKAVLHRDTVLDLQSEGKTVGKLIVYNDAEEVFRRRKRALILVSAAVMCLQCGLCLWYFLYLNRKVVKPFRRLKGFAERVAGGNLDIPLEMDRGNLFGAFTESFDLMRSELKRARMAEAAADAAKKKLVAELSHDIRTPVAGIRAAAEVGTVLTEDERMKSNYEQIIRKSDQINTLITNLFTATLQELKQLSVTPREMESAELTELLKNADYLHRAALPRIPACVISADRLRLQQVFDNIFANSYKYAGTPVSVFAVVSGRSLNITVEDEGGGVREEELPFLTEKFRRGSNAGKTEGAGLGLYLADYFLKEAGGRLMIENGERGLKVTVSLPFEQGI